MVGAAQSESDDDDEEEDEDVFLLLGVVSVPVSPDVSPSMSVPGR